MTLDTEALMKTPNYRAILKIVLKSQIQILVQQLFEHTGEESLLLSANIDNGNLSHLGSESGKAFLTNCADVKTEFLNFCRLRSSGVDLTNATTSEASPLGVNTVPFTRKPYSRLQRRHVYSRLRTLGKQNSNVASKVKEKPVTVVPQTCLKSIRAVDLLVNQKGEGHKKVSFTDQSPPTSTRKPMKEDIVVKTEPKDSFDGNVEGDKYSSDVTMVTEKPTEEEENFQYVLNPEYAEVPWQQDENSITAQNQSKRKQMVPIRITKNSSVLGDDPKPGSSHKTCPSELEHSRVESEGNHGNLSLINKSCPTIFRDKITSDNKWGQTGSTDYVLPTVIQVGMKKKPESSGFVWTEEVTEIPPSSKSYMKTPQIDGIFVTRGEGRYEKLIRCDVCGKVCRTSNMARHKKRYCAALSRKSKSKSRSRTTRHQKDSDTSDIYIDNPMDLSDETLSEMNGSELDNSADADVYVDVTDSKHRDVIIKEEPIAYDED